MADPAEIPAAPSPTSGGNSPARKRKTGPAKPTPAPDSLLARYRADVAGFTAAGGNETVQRVVTAMTRVSKRLNGYYREQLADLAIHPGDWGVLQALGVQGPEGAMTPSSLADVNGVSPSTMTHRLDLLAERGLVERAVDPDNRTRSIVRLSRAGWALFQRVITEAQVVESGMLDPLSDAEQQQLAELLERLLHGLDPRTSTTHRRH